MFYFEWDIVSSGLYIVTGEKYIVSSQQIIVTRQQFIKRKVPEWPHMLSHCGFFDGIKVSDCSVGIFESQVGKNECQVGKYDGQVGKIAFQVGIGTERRMLPTEKGFG
jgi:hypothetical protein